MTRHAPRSAAPAALALALVLLAPPLSFAASSKPLPLRMPRSLPFATSEVVILADAGALDVRPDGSAHARDSRVAGLLASLGLDQGRGVGPALRRGASRSPGVFLLTSRQPGFDPIAASRALQATGAFRAVCPNYRFSLFATTPNDPYLFYQWHVDDGSYADIRLPLAWDLGRGDTSVVIAIMDTGVDTSHPDLASQIWHNPGEVAGNGLDDDANGLIDDYEGWDFGMGDNNPKPEYTADASGIDVGFHGTFCAGIAAAATNNGDGIAGAAWSCRIMPLKVSHPDSGLSASAIAAAFVYAVDKRASVISMSFGGPGDPGVPEFFQELVDVATQAGALCVAAAGNEGSDVPVYPAACNNVLTVAATDMSNARAEFSNWGPWVDVAAPGSYMWSTICQNYLLSDLDQIIYIYFFGWDGLNPYMYGDGTSFACPLTAGVCGLVRARYPYLTPQLVMQQIIATGDVVAYDVPIGVKVNAWRALSLAPTAVEARGPAPARALTCAAPNPIVGSAAIQFEIPARGWTRLTLYDAAGRRVRTLIEGALDAGPHAALWDGRNDRGARLPAAVYFARLESGGAVAKRKVVLVPR